MGFEVTGIKSGLRPHSFFFVKSLYKVWASRFSHTLRLGYGFWRFVLTFSIFFVKSLYKVGLGFKKKKGGVLGLRVLRGGCVRLHSFGGGVRLQGFDNRSGLRQLESGFDIVSCLGTARRRP